MSTANDPVAIASTAAQKPAKRERSELKPPVRDTEFKEKYPPDRELGHELDDSARVWKVFRGEAIDHDDALLKTWNETVNILLTFAGLFSAAVTSFVVASTDDLKPDPNAYVANLIFALGNATAASAFAHLPAPPPLEAAPTSLARVVNGLWFTSLFLALAAALLCILVKQWLDEYTARTRGSAKNPRQWAQRRSFYFQGLTKWNVAAIISFIPLFLHLALFLFLCGLASFLWDLDRAIRCVLLVLMSLLLVFYIVFLFIPVWSGACPYATPLLAQLRNLGYTMLVIVCILRRSAVPCIITIKRCIRLVSHRRRERHPLHTFIPDTLDGGNIGIAERNRLVIDSHIKYLLAQRSRRPFEWVLAEASKTEKYPVQDGDFTDRLDCSALQWLMHDVSDSDAVAVAWQSLGALLENPESRRFTHMRTIMPELVEYAGGHRKLWRTLRTDGVLDDLQLGRMTRSALFLASYNGSELTDILYYGIPYSDYLYLGNTDYPDAALIWAQSYRYKPAKCVVEAVHLLHKQTHRPLPSTAMFLFNQLAPGPDDSALDAATGLLHYCDFRRFLTSWAHVGGVFAKNCSGREANPSHQCETFCIVNALCARASRLIDETSGGSNPRQTLAAPFDAYSHVQLVVRIILDFPGSAAGPAGFPAVVWTVLTDTRYLSHRIQREDRIPAGDWALALASLAAQSDRFYVSFATQYNSIWSRLLRGFCANHPQIILDESIDFDGDAGYAIASLESTLEYITPWQIEIADPALRHARLRSAVTLVQSASMAICSMDPNRRLWSGSVDKFVHRIRLVSILPTDLVLTKEEHNEWVDIFVSTVQHLMVADPLPWDNLRHAVTASADNDVKSFFNEVHACLVEAGPCTKGDCVRKALPDSEWLSALGPPI